MKSKEEIITNITEYKEEWEWLAEKLEIPFEELPEYYSAYNETVQLMRQYHYDMNHRYGLEK